MNGFARVMVSVALLGACAYGMKFTMKTVEVRDAEPTVHEWKSAVRSDTKLLKVEYDTLGKTDGISVVSGEKGSIKAEYSASKADQLEGTISRLDKFPDTPFPSQKVNLFLALQYNSKFLYGRPQMNKGSFINLPKNTPLDISISEESRTSNSFSSYFDLRELDVVNFKYSPYLMGDFDLTKENAYNSNAVDVKLPESQKTTNIHINNSYGPTSVTISKLSRGKIRIEADQGSISIIMPKNLNAKLRIFGNADSISKFDKRTKINSFFPNGTRVPVNLESFGDALGVNLSKRFSLSASQGNERSDLTISIELGSKGSVTFYKAEDMP
jgi:hypothetical protein